MIQTILTVCVAGLAGIGMLGLIFDKDKAEEEEEEENPSEEQEPAPEAKETPDTAKEDESVKTKVKKKPKSDFLPNYEGAQEIFDEIGRMI